MTSNDALGLADKISFQIKYYPDARLTADEARLVIAQLRSPRAVPANGAGREAMEALKALLAASDMNRDDIPDRDQYALLLKCQERARSALASPVVGWHPIETVPKDHLVILVHGPYGMLTAFRDVNWDWWPFPANEPLNYVPRLWQPLPTAPFNPPAPPNGETGISAVDGSAT